MVQTSFMVFICLCMWYIAKHFDDWGHHCLSLKCTWKTHVWAKFDGKSLILSLLRPLNFIQVSLALIEKFWYCPIRWCKTFYFFFLNLFILGCPGSLLLCGVSLVAASWGSSLQCINFSLCGFPCCETQALGPMSLSSCSAWAGIHPLLCQEKKPICPIPLQRHSYLQKSPLYKEDFLQYYLQLFRKAQTSYTEQRTHSFILVKGTVFRTLPVIIFRKLSV